MTAAPTTAPGAARGGFSTRLPYLPGLDGLRAIAVISVLLYHAEYDWIIGGFLGVEVFFVISGYLITSLLLAEWRDEGGIGLRQFWLRRARRLLPALFLVLVVVLLVAVIFLPDEVASLRGDILSSLAYVTNWNFILVEKSYFEAVGRPSLVTHLWSLAVEEQFYLVWPLLFMGGMKVFGRKHFPLVVVAGAFASLALMWVLYDPRSGDPSRVYYGTDTRAAGLLLGCALAFYWSPWRLRADIRRGATIVLDVAGVLALAVLAHMLLFTNEFSPSLYQGGFFRLDLVTLVVIAVAVHPAAHLGRVLGWAPLVWVGLRSYGIYLFHYPVFMLTRPGLDWDVDGVPLLAFRVAVTLALAELSYRYVEMPIRRGALGRGWAAVRRFGDPTVARERMRWAAAGLACSTMVLTLGVLATIAQPPPADEVLSFASPPVTVPDTTTTTAPPDTTTTTAPVDPAASTTVAPPETAPPAPPPLVLPDTARVTFMGDSVMLGAAPNLQALGAGVTVDAAVGRQVQVGLEMLTWYRDNGQLGDVVVVHLGNNGTFTPGQFDDLMAICEGRKVIVLTTKVPRRWQDPNNQVILDGVARHPNAVLLDWKSAGESRDGVFYDDGMHLRPEGAAYYAELVYYLLAS